MSKFLRAARSRKGSTGGFAVKTLKMRHFLVIWLFALTSLIAAAGCDRETPVAVSLEKREPLPPPSTEAALNVAIGAMITPKDAYIFYSRLLDHLGETTGLRIRAVDRGSYQEIQDLLRDGAVGAAFVCSGPYVEGRDEIGLEILAVPVVQGEPLYYSYLIVPADSPARSYDDLRGKTFALTDPHSNTGALVTAYHLARRGESIDSFFGSYIYTYAHDRSISAVAEKIVDGAAVDHLIWEYLNVTDPALTSKTRVVHRSEPYGIPPFVAGPGLDEELRATLRRALLDVHTSEEGTQILKGMMIERFVPGDDALYDSIRDMRRTVAPADRRLP